MKDSRVMMVDRSLEAVVQRFAAEAEIDKEAGEGAEAESKGAVKPNKY
jgi:hypothetical protein